MKKNTTVQPSTLGVKITPLAFKKYGQDYLKIFTDFKKNEEFSPVPYFSVCRSIELFLKALLLDGDIPRSRTRESYLRNLNHDLNKIIEKVSTNNLLCFSSEEKKEIKKANNFYSKKGFEYFTGQMIKEAATAYSGLPDLDTLKKIADKTEEACQEQIKP